MTTFPKQNVYVGTLKIEYTHMEGKRKNTCHTIAKDVIFSDLTDPMTLRRIFNRLNLMDKNPKVIDVIEQKKVGF